MEWYFYCSYKTYIYFLNNSMLNCMRVSWYFRFCPLVSCFSCQLSILKEIHWFTKIQLIYWQQTYIGTLIRLPTPSSIFLYFKYIRSWNSTLHELRSNITVHISSEVFLPFPCTWWQSLASDAEMHLKYTQYWTWWCISSNLETYSRNYTQTIQRILFNRWNILNK